MTNPYRDSFYRRQAEWHGAADLPTLERRHQQRIPYYRWLTRGWLPESTAARILDIGCGAGQFVYFLQKAGYQHVAGIDVDAQQVGMARDLGLNCLAAEAASFLDRKEPAWELISALDILEHLDASELHALLERVAARLTPGGRLILSVPNAESPQGLASRYFDITHENSFTVTSMSEALFCHGLERQAVRDPWPTPIDFFRGLHRLIARIARKVEALRLRTLGLGVPGVWSPVFWMLAVKRTPGTAP